MKSFIHIQIESPSQHIAPTRRPDQLEVTSFFIRSISTCRFIRTFFSSSISCINSRNRFSCAFFVWSSWSRRRSTSFCSSVYWSRVTKFERCWSLLGCDPASFCPTVPTTKRNIKISANEERRKEFWRMADGGWCQMVGSWKMVSVFCWWKMVSDGEHMEDGMSDGWLMEDGVR